MPFPFPSLSFIKNIAKNIFKNVDWVMFGALVPISVAGLLTMNSFLETNRYFDRQAIWILVSFVIFFTASTIDFRFLRRTSVIASLYVFILFVLSALFIAGSIFKGAKSWFDLGIFAFQPAELAKLILIMVLAKYFSRRHVEIANFRHIIVSGVYAMILFLIILLQPDFGSSIIIFCIWFGMVLVSGISKKHLILVFLAGVIAFSGMWVGVFQPYQKDRIKTFLSPLADIHGAGYNAYQSTIAVGSGEMLGKGIGFGTQSKLKFLPEYQTDFIFAAFAEEWGFVGVVLLLLLYLIVIWRIISNAMIGETNFETLFGAGLAVLFTSHFIIHVGMNIGLLPVTGVTIPFMSYGGSHLIVEFAGLGILMGMRGYSRGVRRGESKNEIVGF